MDTPETTPEKAGRLRTKWAAIGAAVAVTLGAGGIGVVRATVNTPSAMPIYVPIEPCRLVDTRPDSTVGARNTPLGAAETANFTGEGAVGNCNLPANTSALQVNATAIGATLPTFLAFFPGGGTVPTSSNLNPVPGAAPTPNSVTVPLNGDGVFSVFNLQGNVHLLVDVVGYYEDHIHSSDDITNEAGVASIYDTDVVSLTTTPTVIATLPIRVPSNGYVTVTASINWLNLDQDDFPNGFDVAQCQITKGTTIDTGQPFFNLNDGSAYATLALESDSSTRTLEVAVADNPLLFFSGQPLNLVCDEIVGDVQINQVHMSAIFTPTSYSPAPLIIVPLDEEQAPVEG